jgi:hypothetical protein
MFPRFPDSNYHSNISRAEPDVGLECGAGRHSPAAMFEQDLDNFEGGPNDQRILCFDVSDIFSTWKEYYAPVAEYPSHERFLRTSEDECVRDLSAQCFPILHTVVHENAPEEINEEHQ